MVSAVSHYDVDISTDCGLHVHMDLTDISLADLKKICMNWVKYEDAIDLCIDENRRDSTNEYCMNVRDNMRFADKTDSEVLELIDSQKSRKGLVNLMNAHPENRNRYYKLNLQNLVNKENPRNTIEFRGHEATMDPIMIENWKQKPIAFGDNTSTDNQFDRLFEKFVKDEELEEYYG
ncbi:MAG: hypothetical protein SGARI_003798 [Bacillariaceae sp.]